MKSLQETKNLIKKLCLRPEQKFELMVLNTISRHFVMERLGPFLDTTLVVSSVSDLEVFNYISNNQKKLNDLGFKTRQFTAQGFKNFQKIEYECFEIDLEL